MGDDKHRQRIERLERCYEIVGNGKAIARMDELLKDRDFRESVRKLAEADLVGRVING